MLNLSTCLICFLVLGGSVLTPEPVSRGDADQNFVLLLSDIQAGSILWL